MKPWLQTCGRGLRFCVQAVWSFCCWTLWLALVLLLLCQVYIVFSRELPVPQFVLRDLESRLHDSGIEVSFARTSIDPTGRVLIENTRLSLPAYEEPIATIPLLYMEFDPWALLVGSFRPTQIRAEGMSLEVPAMLSETGRNESLLTNLDFTYRPSEHGVEITRLTARLANLSVSIHGGIDLRALPRRQTDSMPLAALIAANYQHYIRRTAALVEQLAVLDEPSAEITLTPTEALGAIAQVDLVGGGFHGMEALPFTTGGFQASTKLPLWSKVPIFARVVATVDSLELPGQTRATGLRAILRTRIEPGATGASLRRAEVTLDRLESHGVVVYDTSSELTLRDYPQIGTTLLTHVGTEAVALSGTINAAERSADLHVTGGFDPALMKPLGEQIGHDIRPYINFGSAPTFDLDVRINPGAKFDHLEGQIAAKEIFAYHVTFDRAAGHIFFDGKHFIATQAAAAIGTNYATGSYEHTVATHDFRFLLTGQLRPPDIGGWFSEWWPDFWDNFDFTIAAPDAEVDVQGRWGNGPATSVFVFADAQKPRIKGVALDRVVTRIFVRPHFYDAMEVTATHQGGTARGWFTRLHSHENSELERMDFAFDSTLPMQDAAALAGDEVKEIIAPFALTRSPDLKIKGWVSGPAHDFADGRHIEISGTAGGDFSFHQFPLSNLAFRAVLNDNNLLIAPLSVGFAGGTATGKARIHGHLERQRLGFDISLKNANLSQAATILDRYAAERRHEPPPSVSDYIQQTASVAIDVDMSAEGDLDNNYSYTGTGNAELSGRGLGEVKLLGLLSDLLNFTALRFDNLRTNFSIEKDHLVFPEVSITGSNAAVSAHGNYALEERVLDFNARIYPFQESKFILKSVIGAVLSPLSTVLEVKLTGKLEDPSWAFVIGPTNFLRNLITPSGETPKKSTSPSILLPVTPIQAPPDTTAP